MHINKKSISESIEDSMKNNKPNVKRMRASNPQSVVNPVMSDALKSSEEFDKNSEKVFTDLSKKSKDITPKEPTTGKKVNRKPYTEGFKLDESLFDDSSIKESWCDDKLDELISKPKSEWTQDDYEAYFYCKNALAERDYYDSYDESLNNTANSKNSNLQEASTQPSKELLKYAKIRENQDGSGFYVLKNFVEYGSDRIGGSFENHVGKYINDRREFPDGLWGDLMSEDLDLSNDEDFDTYSNFNSDLYNAMSEVVYNYKSKGISKKDIEKAVEWFLTHFFDDFNESLKKHLHESHGARYYTDMLYDMLENDEVDAKNIAEDIIYWISEDDVEQYMRVNDILSEDEDEEELEESKHIQKTRKKSSKLREASYDGLNDSDQFDEDKDYYNEQVESGHFWDSRTTSKATMGRIADILLKVKEYFVHYYSEDGEDYFNNDLLPKAVKSGIEFGIDPDKLKFVKKWFDSGNPDGEMSKEIYGESYTRKKSSKSSLSESRWDDYNDVEEFDQETVYDFIDERLFGVSYTGRINGGNYRATNKFCSDVWMNLTRPGGSTKKTFFYPDHFDGAIDDESRESSTESRRAPTSDGIAVYLRDESEGNLAKAVADELELNYKVKQIGSYNKTNYKYIATIVIPDYIAEMPIDEYLLTIGKSITDYKKSRKTSKAAERELVAV